MNVDANGNNILGDAANEPSISVHPTNLSKMAIAWTQFDSVSFQFLGGRLWILQPMAARRGRFPAPWKTASSAAIQ
jgi:hypothetical protein